MRRIEDQPPITVSLKDAMNFFYGDRSKVEIASEIDQKQEKSGKSHDGGRVVKRVGGKVLRGIDLGAKGVLPAGDISLSRSINNEPCSRE